MGIDIEFVGAFALDRRLEAKHFAYLKRFGRIRRMKRYPEKLEGVPDPIREAVGLPIGPEGGYFVGTTRTTEWHGEDPTIRDHNWPPIGQPSLWCQWTPRNNGWEIVWDGVERFSDSAAWLDYCLRHFLGPWGYRLEGEVLCQRRPGRDSTILRVRENRVEERRAEGDATTKRLLTEEKEHPRRLHAQENLVLNTELFLYYRDVIESERWARRQAEDRMHQLEKQLGRSRREQP